jgi:hypothetical protein
VANRRDKFSAIRDGVIMEIAAKLKKVTKGRVPDSHIDRVISAFFAAIRHRVEVANRENDSSSHHIAEVNKRGSAASHRLRIKRAVSGQF